MRSIDQIYSLDKWYFVDYKFLTKVDPFTAVIAYCCNVAIQGRIKGYHPKFEEGTSVVTSPITRIERLSKGNYNFYTMNSIYNLKIEDIDKTYLSEAPMIFSELEALDEDTLYK